MEVGYLVTSKAGHDKGKVFLIIAEEDEYVWLADGKTRTQANPKKKKKKHVQIIKVYKDDDMMMRLTEKEKVREEEIRRVIKTYMIKQRNE